MKKLFYRAEYFPTGHPDEDMLWLDFPTASSEGAWAKAEQWEREHEGYRLVGIRALGRKDEGEYPREEPAKYGRDYAPAKPQKGILSALLPIREAVCGDGGADRALEPLVAAVDDGGAALDLEGRVVAGNEPARFEGLHEQVDALGVVERHGREPAFEVHEVAVVLDQLVEKLRLVFREPLHAPIVSRGIEVEAV